jgi:putative transposase
VLAGCRYRACPTPGRGAMLARTFGWAPAVVFNEALRLRRSVVKVSRWLASSPLCPVCGFCSASMPLQVRSWTCPQCAADHDRDVNAARNILVEGRRVATGLAETRNALGGGAGGGLVPAAAREARTRRGAA